MLAHYLIVAALLIGAGFLAWKFFLKDKVMAMLPEEEETPIEEDMDALRARIETKRAELAQLEADAKSLGEEVGVTRQIRDKRKELTKLTGQLGRLEEAMPENPLHPEQDKQNDE